MKFWYKGELRDAEDLKKELWVGNGPHVDPMQEDCEHVEGYVVCALLQDRDCRITELEERIEELEVESETLQDKVWTLESEIEEKNAEIEYLGRC